MPGADHATARSCRCGWSTASPATVRRDRGRPRRRVPGRRHGARASPGSTRWRSRGEPQCRPCARRGAASTPTRLLEPAADQGAEVVRWIQQPPMPCWCATADRRVRGGLAITARYVSEREQFGTQARHVPGRRPAHRRRLHRHRGHPAHRPPGDLAARRRASTPTTSCTIAKFWAADGAQRVVHAAQHLHGGIGVDLDYPIHRYFRWAKVLELTLGGQATHLRWRQPRRHPRRVGDVIEHPALDASSIPHRRRRAHVTSHLHQWDPLDAGRARDRAARWSWHSPQLRARGRRRERDRRQSDGDGRPTPPRRRTTGAAAAASPTAGSATSRTVCQDGDAAAPPTTGVTDDRDPGRHASPTRASRSGPASTRRCTTPPSRSPTGATSTAASSAASSWSTTSTPRSSSTTPAHHRGLRAGLRPGRRRRRVRRRTDNGAPGRCGLPNIAGYVVSPDGPRRRPPGAAGAEPGRQLPSALPADRRARRTPTRIDQLRDHRRRHRPVLARPRRPADRGRRAASGFEVVYDQSTPRTARPAGAPSSQEMQDEDVQVLEFDRRAREPDRRCSQRHGHRGLVRPRS